MCFGDNEDAKTTRRINSQLRADKKRMDAEVKLLLLGKWRSRYNRLVFRIQQQYMSGMIGQYTLCGTHILLGAGESGKSTVAKQMRILHLEGFPTSEKVKYKTIITNNIITAIRALLLAAREFKLELEEQNKV